MNGAEIAQIAIILAPLVKSIAVEGSNIVATYRDNVSQDDLDTALGLSRSASWPVLDFKQQ